MKKSYCLPLEVPEDQQEVALAILYSNGMQGCEERESGQMITYRAYFQDVASLEGARDALAASLPVTILGQEVIEPQDWNAEWRKSMKPAQLTHNMWVSPQWLAPPLAPGDHWIKIEPKMAFGTGHHETTRLAAQAIVRHSDRIKGLSLIDIGTGSGVLCFVGEQCGAVWNLGVELDADCHENLSENRMLNATPAGVSFITGSTGCLRSPDFFGCVVMNMIRTESQPMLEFAYKSLIDNGLLIWSGILTDEQRAVVDAARQAGFDLVSESTENEWWCGTFNKRPR